MGMVIDEEGVVKYSARIFTQGCHIEYYLHVCAGLF